MGWFEKSENVKNTVGFWVFVWFLDLFQKLISPRLFGVIKIKINYVGASARRDTSISGVYKSGGVHLGEFSESNICVDLEKSENPWFWKISTPMLDY